MITVGDPAVFTRSVETFHLLAVLARADISTAGGGGAGGAGAATLMTCFIQIQGAPPSFWPFGLWKVVQIQLLVLRSMICLHEERWGPETSDHPPKETQTKAKNTI